MVDYTVLKYMDEFKEKRLGTKIESDLVMGYIPYFETGLSFVG